MDEGKFCASPPTAFSFVLRVFAPSREPFLIIAGEIRQ
jgi:hypothetical protein